ncbi:MAG: glucose 1-dehydrogenase [Bacteroidota bacterium]
MNPFESFQLNNKVAIVTGASKGIGKSIAHFLGATGAKVVVSSRKQEAIDKVKAEFEAEGITVSAIAANTGSSSDLKELVEKTKDQFGGVDILVNNAATNPVFGPVVNTDEAAFDKIMDINVKGPFELGKLAYESMKSRGGGSIINISSVGGISPEQGLGIYSVSKAALISLTKVMAKEWGRDGIRANVICPGLIKTKFSEALWSNESIAAKMLKMLPISRVGESEEIAGLALFLASPAASYCTGAVFTADGGFTI